MNTPLDDVASQADEDPYDALGMLYDAWVTSVAEDVDFYASETFARGPHPRVLELGAGSGRISLPLAQRGAHVTALDVSSVQLQRLAAKAASEGVAGACTVVHGSMLELPRVLADDAVFDAVIAPFRALLHVAEAAPEVFASVYDVLVPGGVFVFDVFHPSHEVTPETDGEWLERGVHTDDDGTLWRFDERAAIAPHASLAAADVLTLDVRATPVALDPNDLGENSSDASVVATLTLTAPQPEYWRGALQTSGFVIERVDAWFDGRPFMPGDPDSVWVARRP